MLGILVERIKDVIKVELSTILMQFNKGKKIKIKLLSIVENKLTKTEFENKRFKKIIVDQEVTIVDLRNYLFKVASMSHSEMLDIEQMHKTRGRVGKF